MHRAKILAAGWVMGVHSIPSEGEAQVLFLPHGHAAGGT